MMEEESKMIIKINNNLDYKINQNKIYQIYQQYSINLKLINLFFIIIFYLLFFNKIFFHINVPTNQRTHQIKINLNKGNNFSMIFRYYNISYLSKINDFKKDNISFINKSILNNRIDKFNNFFNN